MDSGPDVSTSITPGPGTSSRVAFDEFGEIDPSERDGAGISRRRRFMVIAGVAAAACAGVVTVAIWQPWSKPDTEKAVDAGPTPPELVLDDPAEASLELTSSIIPGVTEDVLQGFGQDIGFLFAADNATLEEGPLFAVIVGGEDFGDDFDEPEELEGLTVDGNPITRAGREGASDVTYEWEVDGTRFRGEAAGVSDVQVVAAASSLNFDGATLNVDPSDDLVDLQPLGTFNDLFLVWSTALPGGIPMSVGDALTSVRYESEDQAVSVSSVPWTGDDPSQLLQLLLTTNSEGTINGSPSIEGLADETVAEEGTAVVAWVQGDRLIAVSGTVDIEQLRELAGSVRAASTQEWDAVLDVAVESDDFLLGNEG